MNIKKAKQNIYKVYDKNGFLKRKIEQEREKKEVKNEDWLKGVSCFVINEKNEVLMEKRGSTQLTPGKMDLCSGHIDNNELAFQAMIRELKEELGITIEESANIIKLTKQGAPLNFGTRKRNKNFFIDFFCLKRNKSEVKIQPEEVDSIVYVPMEECFELIRNGKTKFPANYDYEEIFDKVRQVCEKGRIQEDYTR